MALIVYFDQYSHSILRPYRPHSHTFFDEFYHFTDIEADLVRVLAHVLVYSPAAGALGTTLRFRSRRRTMTDAPFPLLPVTTREKKTKR